MNFLTGVIDPYGVVYVELIDYFQEGHALAAWPGAICGSVMSLSGPLVSAVANKFGLRFSKKRKLHGWSHRSDPANFVTHTHSPSPIPFSALPFQWGEILVYHKKVLVTDTTNIYCQFISYRSLYL